MERYFAKKLRVQLTGIACGQGFMLFLAFGSRKNKLE